MDPLADKAYPSIAQAIILVLLAIAILLGLGIVLGVALVAGGQRTMNPWQFGLANCVALGIALAWGCRKAGVPIRVLLPFKAVAWPLFVAVGVSVVGVGILLSELSNFMLSVMPSNSYFERMLNEILGSRTNPLGAIFLLVVVAPMTEEPLFRGVILHGFLKRYTVRRSIVISAVLFSLMHLNPLQLPGGFVAGLLLGWWRARTRSLWLCLWGHALNNGLPALLAILGVEIAGYTMENPKGQVLFQPLWLDLLGAAMTIAGLIWTASLFRKLPPVIVARPVTIPVVAPPVATPDVPGEVK